MILSDKIAEWLGHKGIEYAYGIIGAGNITLWDAIARRGQTQIVCCHHEQAAVLAAGFGFRTNGRLAAAIVTTGAGQANAITGAISLSMDSTPALILSGNEPSKYMAGLTRTLGVQGFDIVRMMCETVKYARRPTSIGATMLVLEEAYREALAPRQGPVWIDLCRDIQGLNV